MVHVSKWQTIINDLAKTPGLERLVAQDVSPSAATRLRQLGATVRVEATTPRGSKSTGRYDVYAMVQENDALRAALDDDLLRHHLMVESYEREILEFDAKLEANTKARNKLLTKKHAAVYMKNQLLEAQDALRLRRNALNEGDQDG